RAAVAGRNPPVRLLALNWSLEGLAPAEVHAICGTRITARGANHQSLRPAASREHEQVIWMFINKTEGLAPAEVDEVVDMSMGEGLQESVERAVEGVVRVLGLPAPGAEKVREGVERARAYAVAGAAEGSDDNGAKDKGKGKGKAQEKKPAAQERRKENKRPATTVSSRGRARVAAGGPGRAGAHWRGVVRALGEGETRRGATMSRSCIRRRSRRLARRIYGHGARRSTPGREGGGCGGIYVHARERGVERAVMAVTVDDVRLEAESAKGQAGAEFVSTLSDEVRKRLHITVGTRNASIAAVEGKGLVESWRAGKTAVSSRCR
ncbi:hypothetical protein B0H13DRAFT_238324, partial [Mycena leptocephala]